MSDKAFVSAQVSRERGAWHRMSRRKPEERRVAGGRDVGSLLPSLGCLSIGTPKEEGVGVADHEYDGFLVVPRVEDIAPKRKVEGELSLEKKRLQPHDKKRFQPRDPDLPVTETNFLDLLSEQGNGFVLNLKNVYLVWERELSSFRTVALNGTELPPWNYFYPKPEDATMKYTGFDPMVQKPLDGVRDRDLRERVDETPVPEAIRPHFLDAEHFQLPPGNTCSEIAFNAFMMPGGYGEWITSKVKTYEQEVPVKKTVEKKWGMTTKGKSNDKGLADAYAPLDAEKKKIKERKEAGEKLTQKEIDAILKPHQEVVDKEEADFKNHAFGMVSKWIGKIDNETGMLDGSLRDREVPFLYQDMGNMGGDCPMPPGWMTFRQAYLPVPETLSSEKGLNKGETAKNIFNNKFVGPTIKAWKEYSQTGEMPAKGWGVMAAKSTSSAWLMFMGMATSDAFLEAYSAERRVRTKLDQGVGRETLDPRELAQMEATERRRAEEKLRQTRAAAADDRTATAEEQAKALLELATGRDTAKEVEDEGAGKGFEVNDPNDFEVTDVQEDDDSTDDELIKEMRAITEREN